MKMTKFIDLSGFQAQKKGIEFTHVLVNGQWKEAMYSPKVWDNIAYIGLFPDGQYFKAWDDGGDGVAFLYKGYVNNGFIEE